jgi:uncharacterized membrane protein
MKLLKELSLMGIVAVPFIYLSYIWDKLPEIIPVHWNYKGEIDRYGNKIEILLIPILLPLLTYLIFLIVPKIDPKNKIKNMGVKFENLKILTVTFMSILASFILHSIYTSTILNSNFLILLIGVLYIILGNYFKTIKANYFIGIRTPWTLESELVWKETHKLGGVIWFIGGVFVVFASLFFSKEINKIIFFTVTVILALVPTIYSYVLFQNEKNKLKI